VIAAAEPDDRDYALATTTPAPHVTYDTQSGKHLFSYREIGLSVAWLVGST
jgi:hypothetical protein